MSVHLMDDIGRQPGVVCVKVREDSDGRWLARIDLDLPDSVALCYGRGDSETAALEDARDKMERALMEPPPWERDS